MMELYNKNVLCLFLGTLSWLLLFSFVNADGRVFLLDLRNSSAPQGSGAAEHACASYDARLASAEELRHAVVECSFSACTHGWLFGGTVGTTVCNNVGSALKAVDVKIKNTTEGTEYLNAFCVKDKGVPCGDPPSFPNTRLQGHTGFEMGDELLYTCVPGHVMPSGHRAFSLLCDSCGEWYGLVQLCVRDQTETHIDYEDKFTDTYGDPEEHSEEELHEEAQGEVHEELHEAAFDEDHAEKGHSQEQQEASFTVEEDQGQEEEAGGEELSVDEEEEEEKEVREENAEVGEQEEEVEDSTRPPGAEQEHEEVAGREVTESVEMTEAPVSLISQKHLFWFPSEAFEEEGHLAPTQPPLTRTTLPEGDNRVRASGGQSEESKEYDSQEGHDEQPDDREENEPDNYEEHEGDHHDDRDEPDDGHRDDRDDPEDSHHDDHDDSAHDDQDDHEERHHDDQDDHDDSQHDDRDDPDNSQPEDHDEHVEQDDHDKHYIPSQQEEELEKGGPYEDRDDHDDHYDMGEHEEDDRHRVHYGSQGEHEDPDTDHSEDHDLVDDVTDDPDHPGDSEEHPDADDHHDDHDDSDKEEDHHYDHEHHERDHKHHEHKDHDRYDHDDHDDHHRVPLVVMTTDEPLNVTYVGAGEDPTTSTDETWLDGYPVVPDETEKVGGGSTAEEGAGPEPDLAGGVTDSPNEVEVSQPVPYTSPPQVQESATREPDTVEQGRAEDMSAGLSPSPSPGSPEPSDYDTDDYATPASPTDSWEDATGGHPFLDHGLVPTAHTDDVVTVTGELEVRHAEHNLTGQAGERGDVEGEMGETTCVDEDCPPQPPPSSGRGPTVAAVIVAVCAVAAAAVTGAWCYRRRQQKSSMCEMNGKGQGQSRQRQQIEMQQKV